MTESHTSRNPRPLVRRLGGNISQRKTLLFICGIMRIVHLHAPIRRFEEWIEREERHVDRFGRLSSDYLSWRMVNGAVEGYFEHSFVAPNPMMTIESMIDQLLTSTAGGDARHALRVVLRMGERFVANFAAPGLISESREWYWDRSNELLRELFPPLGLDYRLTPSFSGGGILLPNGQTYHVSETARSLAIGIRDENAFDRLPILADALEDADCPDRVWLDHLRFGTKHARGCWALDLALGRN